MRAFNRFADKSLAVVLSLSLLFPGLGAAASIGAEKIQVGASVRSSVSGAVITLKAPPLLLSRSVGSPSLAPNAALAGSPIVAAPAVTPGAGVAAPESVLRHPIVELLIKMQKAGIVLPDAATNRADAAQLIAAAETLPEGAARQNLIAMALAITAPGASVSGAQLGKVYDNGSKDSGNSEVAPTAVKATAAERFWSAMGKLLKRSPKAQPRDAEALKVPIESLRFVPPAEILPASTKDISLGDKQVVGQDNALKALTFGLKMPGDNYNLYVSGPQGSGRSTAVRHILEQLAPTMATPGDLVAATNFADEDNPVILELAPGQGAAFEEAVSGFVSRMRQSLPEALGTGALAAAKKQMTEEYEAEAGRRQAAIDEKISAVKIGKFGLAFVEQQTEEGAAQIGPAATFEGQVLSEEERDAKIAAGAFTRAEWDDAQAQLAKKAKPFLEEYAAMLGQNQEQQEAVQQKMAGLDSQAAAAVVKQAAKPMMAAVLKSSSKAEQKKAMAYVKSLMENAAAKYQQFLPQKEEEADPNGIRPLGRKQDASDAYRVSVLVDNAGLKGAPVVWEQKPSYENLFGAADSNAQTILVPGAGLMKTRGAGGPTLRAGSYLKARGGFLILDVMDVLREPGAWQALMAAIRSGDAEIAEGGSKGQSYHVPGKTKVVLIGAPSVRMLLQEHDEDFGLNFNSMAEFEPSLAITRENMDGYLQFLKKAVVGSGGQIMDLTRDAISSVLELSARLVDSNTKLSAQFGALYTLLREATFWARESGGGEVRAQDINQALNARGEREAVYQRRHLEMYKQDIFHVATSGSEVGQINGLAVMGGFGVPMRITVVHAPGAFNLGSADKEAGTTGSSYNKSFAVVRGYLTSLFQRMIPANISVSFEQNYGGIDGDSATSTMMYSVLSSLSGVPIKQSFAVTGSADQFGNIQAIGGVNEKIEGFFDLVHSRGLTGEQGIVIPATNVGDLMLRADIVEAVRQGKFHIYAVKTVAEGMEILTGTAYSEIVRLAQANIKEMGKKTGE